MEQHSFELLQPEVSPQPTPTMERSDPFAEAALIHVQLFKPQQKDTKPKFYVHNPYPEVCLMDVEESVEATDVVVENEATSDLTPSEYTTSEGTVEYQGTTVNQQSYTEGCPCYCYSCQEYYQVNKEHDYSTPSYYGSDTSMQPAAEFYHSEPAGMPPFAYAADHEHEATTPGLAGRKVPGELRMFRVKPCRFAAGCCPYEYGPKGVACNGCDAWHKEKGQRQRTEEENDEWFAPMYDETALHGHKWDRAMDFKNYLKSYA